jgi:hypothetical protein
LLPPTSLYLGEYQSDCHKIFGADFSCKVAKNTPVLNKFVGWWPAVELMKQYLHGVHCMQHKAKAEGVDVENQQPAETPEIDNLEDFEVKDMDTESEVDDDDDM